MRERSRERERLNKNLHEFTIFNNNILVSIAHIANKYTGNH